MNIILCNEQQDKWCREQFPQHFGDEHTDDRLPLSVYSVLTCCRRANLDSCEDCSFADTCELYARSINEYNA